MSKRIALLTCLAACSSVTPPPEMEQPDAAVMQPDAEIQMPMPDASTCTIAADATVTARLVVTADDHYKVYVNGVLIDDVERAWSDPQGYDVTLNRRRKNVIAIEAHNAQTIDGTDRGALVDLRATEGVVVSDGNFKVTTTAATGFEQLAFDDTTWGAPFVIGNATVSPWYDVFATLAPSSTAQWIWSYDPNLPAASKVNEETVYARRTFQFAAPGCPDL